jgi:hypothetical protein
VLQHMAERFDQTVTELRKSAGNDR